MRKTPAKSNHLIFGHATLLLLLFCAAPATSARSTAGAKPIQLWDVTVPPGNDPVRALALDRDGIVYGTTWGSARIFALGADGSLRRSTESESRIFAMTVGNNGAIYIAEDKDVYSYPYAESKSHSVISAFGSGGALKWRAGADGFVRALAVAPNGLLYVGANQVEVLSPDGSIRRKFPRCAPPLSLAITETMLYVGGWAGLQFPPIPPICAFHTDSGEPNREFSPPRIRPRSLLAGKNGLIYEAEGWPGHVIYALDSQNGALKWQFKTAGMPLALALGNNGLLYLGAFDGNVYALDAAIGALRWIFSTKGKGWGTNEVRTLAVSRDEIVYAGVADRVVAIRASTLELRDNSRFHPDAPAYNPVRQR